jgi:D-sedoheptulose 7-phosphate isomerase
MTREDIIQEFRVAQEVLSRFINDDSNWEKMMKAAELMADSIKAGGKIISCGNGGSMSDAMHFAEELTGRFRDDREGLAAIAISDPTHNLCWQRLWFRLYFFAIYRGGREGR